MSNQTDTQADEWVDDPPVPLRVRAKEVQDNIGWSDTTDLSATSMNLLALAGIVTELARAGAALERRLTDVENLTRVDL